MNWTPKTVIPLVVAALVVTAGGAWFLASREAPQEARGDEPLAISSLLVTPSGQQGMYTLRLTYTPPTRTEDVISCSYENTATGEIGFLADIVAPPGDARVTEEYPFLVSEPGSYRVGCMAGAAGGQPRTSNVFTVAEPETRRAPEGERGGRGLQDDLGIIGIVGGSVSQSSEDVSARRQRSGTTVRTPFFPGPRQPTGGDGTDASAGGGMQAAPTGGTDAPTGAGSRTTPATPPTSPPESGEGVATGNASSGAAGGGSA